MILVIDNYDSFTYNIVQYLGKLGQALTIWRNDQFTLEDLESLNPDGIILSPGPGHPRDAGKTCEVIEKYTGKYPMMGVCLGHQAIGLVEGGIVNEAHEQLHGKISRIKLENDPIFKGMPKEVDVVRYHSLVIDKAHCPDTLKVISEDAKGEIMAIRHKEHPVYGVQFHPESYSTENGICIFENFIDIMNACK